MCHFYEKALFLVHMHLYYLETWLFCLIKIRGSFSSNQFQLCFFSFWLFTYRALFWKSHFVIMFITKIVNVAFAC